MSTLSISAQQSAVLKGFAISAVLLIHFIAFLPHVFTPTPSGMLFTAIDQLSRFCVPLFLYLSAYGLSKKYAGKTLQWKEYLVSRLGKLIPLYILWSVFSMLVFWFIPRWGYDNRTPSLVTQILLGQSDFQLYFMPLIFQMYVLFPLLRLAVRRFPLATLIGSVAIQVVWFALIGGLVFPVPTILQTDRVPYVLFISWIAYFVAGIYMAEREVARPIRAVLPIAVVASLAWAMWSSMKMIHEGIDPLIAMRFTRFPVFAFAGSLCLFAPQLAKGVEKLGVAINRAAEFMGRNSYILFLAHTMALRLMYAAIYPLITWQQFFVVAISWVGLILVSNRMLRRG